MHHVLPPDLLLRHEGHGGHWGAVATYQLLQQRDHLAGATVCNLAVRHVPSRLGVALQQQLHLARCCVHSENVGKARHASALRGGTTATKVSGGAETGASSRRCDNLLDGRRRLVGIDLCALSPGLPRQGRAIAARTPVICTIDMGPVCCSREGTLISTLYCAVPLGAGGEDKQMPAPERRRHHAGV